MAKKEKREVIVAKGGNIQDRLKLAVAKMEKDYGVGSVMILGKGAKPIPIPRIDSGSHYVNDLLGGGWAEGRLFEVYGPESSGKTTVALHAVAMSQKKYPDKFVLYIDTEHALDMVYAEALGVDLSLLAFVQPDTAEEALRAIETFIEQDLISMYVVDSVASMIPRSELEGEIGDNHVGTLARLMSTNLKRIAMLTHKSSVVGIFINQLREKVGVMFGNPETTPGGKSLKFYASARLDIRPSGVEMDKNNQPTIRKTKIKIVKSKISTPHRVVEVDIEFGKGISRSGEIIDIGIDLGLITKSGAWHYYKDIIKAQGRENMKLQLEANPELMDTLNDRISDMMKPVDIVTEPELGDIPETYVDDDELKFEYPPNEGTYTEG